MGPILIEGMQGLGDNLHQRAVVRAFLRDRDVCLKTSWPAVYHDLVGPRLQLIRSLSMLRTQAKNERREADRFFQGSAPANLPSMRVWYPPQAVRQHGAVLSAMLAQCGLPPDDNDFRLPVPAAWREAARAVLPARPAGRPILIYRPLVERREWGGCAARNPDHRAYGALYAALRDRFFVVSVADLVDGVEWMVGERVTADLELPRGELAFEALAGLFAQAAMVFAAPGFAVPLAQSVGTPVVCVFGGYENARSFSAGARFAPYLGLEPIAPCDCFAHHHACNKTIDLAASISKLSEFLDDVVADHRAVRA